MKYSTEVTIELPRNRVLELFDNADNLSRWQEGLVSFTPISGEPGHEGAKASLKYKMGNREVEVIETITKRNLPDEFHGSYHTRGMYNLMENYFIEEGDKTLWRSISDFRGENFMMKTMLVLMPGMFKKRTKRLMNAFREFAESEGKS